MDSHPVVETHISTLTFVGETVRKRRKPVALGFLDFTSLEARRVDCEREVRLNRRLAPDVYLGVEPVADADGAVVDYETVMRRMPDDRRLSSLATSADRRALQCVALVAEQLAALHRASPHSPAIDAAGSRDSLRAHWTDNLRRLRAIDWIDDSVVGRIDHLAMEFLAGRRALFDSRTADGRAVDGHGDLLADDIFLLDDGPRILDCLEFDDALRCGDGLLDAAFLAMDLEHLGRDDLATAFLTQYRIAMNDDAPSSLAHHFVAHRACIRALVAGLRDQVHETTRFLDLASRHARAAAVHLVVVGGAPGTGKSTLATGIADARGWALLRSDAMRSRDDDRYAPERVLAVYREMVERAQRELELGRSVILDATWRTAELRSLARATAAETHSVFVEFRCEVAAPVAAERVATRLQAGKDASEATPGVARTLRAGFEPWPSAIPLDTAPPSGDVLATALGWLGSAP